MAKFKLTTEVRNITNVLRCANCNALIGIPRELIEDETVIIIMNKCKLCGVPFELERK